jgi:hypothetical protein
MGERQGAGIREGYDRSREILVRSSRMTRGVCVGYTCRPHIQRGGGVVCRLSLTRIAVGERSRSRAVLGRDFFELDDVEAAAATCRQGFRGATWCKLISKRTDHG